MSGAMLGSSLSGFLPGSLTGYAWILTLSLALAVGICCAVCRRSFVMLATAYSGAFLMAAPICFLLRERGSWGDFVYADGALATMLQLNRYLTTGLLAQQMLPLLLGTVILTAVGFACQKKSDLA